MHPTVFDIWYFELIQGHLTGCLQFCFENNALVYTVHSPTNALFIKLGKV